MKGIFLFTAKAAKSRKASVPSSRLRVLRGYKKQIFNLIAEAWNGGNTEANPSSPFSRVSGLRASAIKKRTHRNGEAPIILFPLQLIP
jgi:hypothetical protein